MKKKMHIACNAMTAWSDLVSEACHHNGYKLSPALHHYLMITLDDFSLDSSLSTTILTMRFIQKNRIKSCSDAKVMRKLGDECLLLSGLFPGNIKHKNLSEKYVIGLGQDSYETIAACRSKHGYDVKLFSELSQHFMTLVDTLQKIKTK